MYICIYSIVYIYSIMYKYLSLYIYIYIYIFMHVCIYIYIYTHVTLINNVCACLRWHATPTSISDAGETHERKLHNILT